MIQKNWIPSRRTIFQEEEGVYTGVVDSVTGQFYYLYILFFEDRMSVYLYLT